jgi:hypothetical protein
MVAIGSHRPQVLNVLWRDAHFGHPAQRFFIGRGTQHHKLLKKCLDKPSQLQPREQTQMGRLVLIRGKRISVLEWQKQPLDQMAQKLSVRLHEAAAVALKLQCVIQTSSAGRREII